MKIQKKSQTQKKNKVLSTGIASTEELHNMCKKYKVTTSGSKQEIAKRLLKIRGNTMTKLELRAIIPLIRK